jgi:CheY-like chemotaxis protein
MKTIMVVEDDPDQLHTLKQILEETDSNYQIVCASGGTRCLNYLVKNDIPDLILLDVMMPKMNGWETFQNIQANEDWRDIPIIFLSARSDDFVEKAGNFLGTDFIQKPFDIDHLRQKIREILAI